MDVHVDAANGDHDEQLIVMQRVVPTTAALVVLVVGLLAPTSDAAIGTGAQSPSTSAASGTWAAVATTSSAPPYTNAALELTFGVSVIDPPAPQYFNVVNTGTLPLTGATYSAAISGAPGATATIYACVGGTWNEGTGACSGTITSVVTSAEGTASSTVVATAVNASVRLQANVTTVLSLPTTLTVDVSVDRSQARTATTTNS